MSSEYFVRHVTADDVFQEPLLENNRMIELAFSTENDPKFCQVCESMEFLIDISRDIGVVEEFGRMLEIRDERMEKYMKYLCLECDTKICAMIDFRKQFITTYRKLFARMECAEETEGQLERFVVTPPRASPEKESFTEAANTERHEESNKEIVAVSEKDSENIRMHAKVPQVDNLSTFTCEYCKKSYKSKAALRTHVSGHIQQGKVMERPSVPQKEQQKHICGVCGYKTKLSNALETHMMIHTGEKAHKCSKCCKDFTLKSSLNVHMLIHTGEKPFICGICSISFNRKSTLKTHMMIHTGEKPHKCTKCGKNFVHKGSLNMHIRTHTGKKPHKCTKCGKDFSQKCNLDRHMLTHTNEKPYKCGLCSKCYNDPSSLRYHKLTHTGEKPHKCTKCGKVFIQKRSLNVHMLIHTGEKPFICGICSISFKRKVYLKTHMMIHTGEKPHNCTKCDKNFAQKNNLNAHMRRIHRKD